MSKPTSTASKIEPSDIEAKFRELQGRVDDVAEHSKKKAAVGGVVAAVLLLALIYLMGRRSGKRGSTMLEIRRL